MAERSEGHWLIEEGIGEHRAALVKDGHIVAAKLDWPGGLAPGLVQNAVLIHRRSGSPRGTARFKSGEEALVDGLQADASEGASLRLRVTRSSQVQGGRAKLAHARPTHENPRPAPTLAQSLGGRVVRRLDEWEDLWLQAFHGHVDFAGGSLLIEPTAALTAIDIDGDFPPRDLAMAAVGPVASVIRRFDLAGSIVIDFPGLAAKDERRAVDAALARALVGWPHEATAMNGFGLVQLVARLERPSLLQRLASDRAGAAARLLLRRAEAENAPGAIILTCSPVVATALKQEWLDELARRTGREIRLTSSATLALTGSFAQAVTT